MSVSILIVDDETDVAELLRCLAGPDRPRQRSSEPAPRKAQIGLGPLSPGHPSPVATTARLRDHSARHVISRRILSGRVEIPIEPAATLRPTSRLVRWGWSGEKSIEGKDSAAPADMVKRSEVLIAVLVANAAIYRIKLSLPCGRRVSRSSTARRSRNSRPEGPRTSTLR